MKKTHLLLLSTALVSLVSLTGCDNKEKIRHEQCSKAILDFNQATIKGDLDIDTKAANNIIEKYACTYKDVTPEEKQQRNEYLAEHPITHKADPDAHFRNGKDWSNLYPEKKPVDWTGKSQK